MNIARPTRNQICSDNEFFKYVNEELLTEAVDSAEFWNTLTTALKDVVGNEYPTNAEVPAAGVSLLAPRYTLKALNSRWGSLYSALYHEDAIPHSAGLKTGSKYNIARGSRVISYAKEFLDSAFPLTEGSHKDAVSYMVYYQNMMVILADGSTAGLRTPAHFAAKSGPKSDPDSIVLKHKDLHVEIVFNRCGATGSQDIANIDDIRIEAVANTLVSCQADTATDKYAAYRNLQALVKGNLKSKFTRDGKMHTRLLNRNEIYTGKKGNGYKVQGCNPVVLQLAKNNKLELMWDEQQNPIPAAIIDAVIASLTMLHVPSQGSVTLSLMAPDALIADYLQKILVRLSSVAGMPENTIKIVTRDTAPTNKAKESTASADMRPDQLPCIDVAEEELKNHRNHGHTKWRGVKSDSSLLIEPDTF